MSSLPVAPDFPTVILNVDDYEPGRYAVTRMLQNQRYVVREAANGREALQLTASEHPDLILLDVNLPDMSGFDVCRQIKSDPKTAHIPVLHLSATYRKASDKVMGLELGADNYLVEPVEPEVLFAAIRAALRTRRAEDAVHTMAQQWRTAFDSIRDGIAMLDAQGRIVRCNRTLTELLGKQEHELIGQRTFDLWPREARPENGFAFQRMILSGRREEMELRLGKRWFQITADPVFGEAGGIEGAAYLVSDISARKQLEAQFREAQKFESIGALAGGVAHDFNNLLTCILGNASLVISDLAAGNPARERIQQVIQAGEKAAALTRQLLAYAGKGRFILKPLDLSRAVRDVRGLIESSVPRKVELQFELAPDLPRVEADARQVEQVLLNLVLNAAEAIGDENGKIVVRTGVRQIDGDAIARLQPGRYSTLEVVDTGCGMDEPTRSRVFDPFFTTKFMGRGLGLAAVDGIVRGHRGAVEVDSTPGVGTTFRILFPAIAEPRHITAAIKHGAVLVVDDEEMVRRVAQAALELRGYTVLTACNGKEAVDLVRRESEIALVLMDLMMPVMGGEEAAQQIRRLRPGLPIIASSGFDAEQAARRFGSSGFTGFLQKPYTVRQLAASVEAWLSSKSSREAGGFVSGRA